ncbi:GTP pyrophosphokinase family protein [Ruminococcus sp. CLA-AA-H200]|uniref:GTP pyrophosphokinase family protein n=1 Tax=Ruminococcus turbiniformis TaxID=2881258 RepID=A0ABS8FY47_9FIRM|nr:GTP pyrophosphokinase family protein [Ruminococcus turbiniformis]MCC2254990.1 GTP pyrophosphokinase family protein [Ruminococcus turbiniformis]
MEDREQKKNELWLTQGAGRDLILGQAMDLLDSVLDYKELIMGYACAIKEINTKFEVLDTEFGVRYKRNPISSIHTRLKSQTSILEKMARLGIPPTRENIENNLNDIAGVRVICAYIDDIYMLADALTRQDDIRLIKKKDYIKNPKPNGYRSLHLIVSVPIFFAESKKEIRAEVQIRTIAMDFWASLEHQIKYKKHVDQAEDVIARLKECADEIAHVDQTMQEIRMEMDRIKEKPSDIEAVYEKLKRLDISLL